MRLRQLRHLLMRIGISLVFLIFGIWEITSPAHWASYVPSFLTSTQNTLTLVRIHGSLLLIIGLAILTGTYLRIAASLGSIILLLIIVSLMIDTGYIEIVVRDVALLFLAVSVALDEERYLTLTK